MSLVGFKARNHGQQVRKRGRNPDVDDRQTSPEVFDPIHERFDFSIDVAASVDNAKCTAFYSIEDDGLAQTWTGRVWCNPPYSDIGPWVSKAWAEFEGGNAELVVLLVPANRTEQGWWQEMIEPFRDRPDSPLRTEFFRGRLRFIARGADGIKPNERPPFGCVLLIWGHAAERVVSGVAANSDSTSSLDRAIGPETTISSGESTPAR